MSPAPAADASLEQAGELKIGQVGIANLRIRTLDIDRLAGEMRERVQRAPNLFARAAVVVDFGALSQLPDRETAASLILALRDAGVLPVALAYGAAENARLATELGLPLLAKFREQYGNPNTSSAAGDSAPAPAAPPAPVAAPATGGETRPGLIQTAPVRSGQQLYADGRDLTVLTAVGAGAEVIADGSIHVYGPLRGRALAGAQGHERARIFCREFHAELVAIAGHYKVLDDIPAQLHGKPVQVWLERDELKFAQLY